MNRILKDQNSQDLRKASICRVSCRVAQRTIHYMWGNCVSPDSFTGLLVSIFFILGSIGILNHAMWRDEINVWLIARDSASIMELFSNIKYEGHPGLWYICLYLLNQITHNPVIMQIFHLLLATGVIYIFVKLSPFTRLQKVLFCFGYLPFYEYLLISRNYAIGVLLTFLFCGLFSRRTKGYILLSGMLFLLANSNAYGLLIAIALGFTLIFEYILDKLNAKSLAASQWNLLVSLLIFILGIVTSLAQLIPPKDSTLAGGLAGWTLEFNFMHLMTTLTRIWSSYIVIIVPNDRNPIEMSIFALISLGLFGFSATLFVRKPVALFLYVFGTLEILLFTYLKFLGGPRHYGHLYILWIVSFWIASYYPNQNLVFRFQSAIASLMSFTDKHKQSLIMVILYAQLAGGIVAFSRDLLLPFSASRETARFIQSQQLDRMFIVGSKDYAISPLCGYLERKIYYPQINRMGSFVLFTTQRKEVDATAVLEQVSRLIKEGNINILLILNYELTVTKAEINVSALAKFTNSFMSDEKYYLYLASPSVKV